MEHTPIYLDYAATSPVDPRVAEVMARALTRDGDFANPSSTHAAGRAAHRLVDQARERMAERIGAEPDEIILTSGATEASNLAIRGVLDCNADERRHIVSSRIEHPSVLEVVAWMERHAHCTATRVACGETGVVAVEEIVAAIQPSTVLASIMHVNNETGAVQDIPTLANACRERGVLLHVDAAQSAGKLPLNLRAWGVDLCSLTAHKLNGPKGIGALYVRRGVALTPLLHGGEQQHGLRPGTLPTHQIVGMGEAFRLSDPDHEGPLLAAMKTHLHACLQSIGDVQINGDPAAGAPHILNVAFPGVDAQSLQAAVPELAVSTGSACMALSGEGSHVLSSMGVSAALAGSSLRFSVGRFTTRADIDHAVARLAEAVVGLRRLSRDAPNWCRA